jgi:hypothetical protein
MAKFGIDSNMVFDVDGKSVAARLSDHDTSLDGLTTDLTKKANQTDLNVTNANVTLKANQSDLDFQKSRIDIISTLPNGSTTGDAELMDGRLDNDGSTSKNIGSAIRLQIKDVLNQIGNIPTTLTTMDIASNQVAGRMYGSVGTTITFDTSSPWYYTYIPVNYGERYQVTTSLGANTSPYVMFTNESLLIVATDFNGTGTQTNPVTRTMKVPSGATRMYVLSIIYPLDGRILKINYSDLQTQIGVNPNIIRMGNLTTSISNATITNKTSQGATLTFGSGVTSQGIFTASSTTVNVGDFIFVRVKLQSNNDSIVTLITYGSTSSMDYERDYHLKAGVQYELYVRTFNFTATGSLKFIVQSDAVNANGQVLTITDLMMIKNSYDAWYDSSTKQSLKDFTKREVIVDAIGGGHFYNIDRACTFLKRAFDVDNIPATVKVKNGYYLQYPTNTPPYAPISKGSNKISIIGESRDGVVIECFNTGTTQSKVIDIGGECTIENLTVRSLNDGTYNSSNDLAHNAYCIHNDTAPTIAPTKQYKTTIKNCLLYSECHSPIGAGLKDKQIQRFENCEFISNGFISTGALYVHGSTDAAAANMGVEIVNCSCVSLDGTKAITLPNVTGSLQYTDIPVTIQKTIGYTTGAKLTDDNFKTTHKLQPYSVLNNVVDWNY